MTTVWAALCLSLFPISLWYICEAKCILALLKTDHPQKWNELGNLGVIKNNSIGNSSKFVMFLLKSEYKTLHNVELTQKANKARLLLIAGYLMAALAFIAPIVIGQL